MEEIPTPDQELREKYQNELNQALIRFAKASGRAGELPDVPVGQSPRELVWTRNKAQLYHYFPQSGKHYTIPLLLVYSIMNKPFILDLRPGSSLVEFLLKTGFEVYLVDWGLPGPEDASQKIDDYVLDLMPRLVKQVLRHSGATEISLLGYCIGGVFAICYAALHPQAPVKNLLLMAVPLDYNEMGLFQRLLDPTHFDVNAVIDGYGLVPGEMLDLGAKFLKPLQNFITTYTSFQDKILDDRAVESWLSIQKWLNDTVPFPGGAFKQFVVELYGQNKLVKGQLKLGGQAVDLSRIKISLLNIMAKKDDMVLASQSKPVLRVVGSRDKEEIIMPGGHIGLVVGRNANKNLWPALENWLKQRSGLLFEKPI